ncbi:MAG: hypothetical protein JZU55_19690 [Afipia sp.]|nr:hypothetical protein [Afipia sp.]
MLALNRASLYLEVDIKVESDFDFLSAEYRAFHNRQRLSGAAVAAFNPPQTDAASVGQAVHGDDPKSRQ